MRLASQVVTASPSLTQDVVPLAPSCEWNDSEVVPNVLIRTRREEKSDLSADQPTVDAGGRCARWRAPTFSGRHPIRRIGTRLGRVAQARAKAAAATTAEQRAEAVEQENRGRLRPATSGQMYEHPTRRIKQGYAGREKPKYRVVSGSGSQLSWIVSRACATKAYMKAIRREEARRGTR